VWQEDILRYSSEDVEHGCHGGGHVCEKDMGSFRVIENI